MLRTETLTEMKNAFGGFVGRLDMAEEKFLSQRI